MKEIIMCTITGSAVGAIFTLLKLPVPVPPVFPAVMGIVGLWIGSTLIGRMLA
jgi:XapX domain-containing protein